MIRRFYLGIENLALTNAQRNTLIAGIQTLGPTTDPSPARRNHWRIRTDNQAAIFEAEFDDSFLTVDAFRQRLATIFSVAVANVTASALTSNQYGVWATFSYQSTPRLRILLFGGASATYSESHAAVLQYLADNRASWDEQAG